MGSHTTSQAFWIDYEHDRAQASDRDSRYSAYVRQARHRFNEIDHDDPAVEFAALAWRTATGPVMAPGLVRFHPRISGATPERSQWDGSMIATADIVSELPESLHKVRPAAGGWFRSWQRDSWDIYEGISDSDLVSSSYMLPSVRVALPLTTGPSRDDRLVLPRFTAPIDQLTEAELTELAWNCVEALVPVMNMNFQPIIDALEHRR